MIYMGARMKRTPLLLVIFACFCLFLSFPAVSMASKIEIDFDTFPDGSPVPVGASITDQYSAYGVTFSSTNGGGCLIWSQGEASSPPNLLVGNPNSFYPIIVDFADLFVTSFSAIMLSVGDARVNAIAYASDLTTVLDGVSVRNPGTNNGVNNKDPITLLGEGIARVTFEIFVPHPGDGFGIDDLAIESSAGATPEPSTLVLTLSAVGAGCWWYRRRKYRGTNS
jgi:hypothetical protein